MSIKRVIYIRITTYILGVTSHRPTRLSRKTLSRPLFCPRVRRTRDCNGSLVHRDDYVSHQRLSKHKQLREFTFVPRVFHLSLNLGCVFTRYRDVLKVVERRPFGTGKTQWSVKRKDRPWNTRSVSTYFYTTYTRMWHTGEGAERHTNRFILSLNVVHPSPGKDG